MPGSINWNDYRLDTTYVLPSGSGPNNWVGIAFRKQKTTVNATDTLGYEFVIGNANHYILTKLTTVGDLNNHSYPMFESLSAGFMDIAPYQGAPVNITLFVKGNTIVAAINGNVVVSYTDTANPFTAGYLSLVAGNDSESPAQQVAFTHIDVYPAPSQLPSLKK